MKSRKYVITTLTTLAGLGIAATAWAAAWTTGGDQGYYTIRNLEVDTYGYIVHIEGGLSSTDRGNCEADFIWAADSSFNLPEQNKAVLAAFLAGKKVRFNLVSGCSTSNRKKYSSVLLHKDK